MIVLVVVAIGIGVALGVRNLLPLSPATGTLTGTFQAAGGPSGAGPRALSGTITAKTSGRGVLSFPVGADGRFTVHSVVVGAYTVSGRSPQYEGGKATCHATGPVTVTKDRTSTVKVYCQEK
ncbi:MAG: hypothetical protein ACRDZR_11505 [Acidimicrobiales bacterium]